MGGEAERFVVRNDEEGARIQGMWSQRKSRVDEKAGRPNRYSNFLRL